MFANYTRAFLLVYFHYSTA